MDTIGYLYENSFVASTPLLNLLFYNYDTGGPVKFGFTYYLSSGITYILVVTTSSTDVTGAFSILASGPSEFTLTLIVITIPTGTTIATTAAGPCAAKPGSIVIADIKAIQLEPRSLSPPIVYHRGPVVSTPVVYVIWYGNWTGNNGTTLIENFLRGLGSTPWWSIDRAYNNTSPIRFGRSTSNSYSQGKTLTQADIFAIVQQAITSSALPRDTNGIYFVLTSVDCTATYFCTQACGWHSTDFQSGLIYSWIGNPEQLCPRSCSYQQVSPNGNVGADAMVSVIAHEAAEAVSDPYLNAWFDSNCDEVADKCAWTFGTTTALSNGAVYNMVVNNVKYLVQQNWRLATQDCGMS
ncbi:unnamed protein product [Rotaria magnacalcarata]|uniref:Uncharacterized protein n=1 Tax=Rotaria magnacalcarata TaxID=392030 RepID=A0A817A3P7_9BILA|nr:unnamed protein product [Rotaria magnacalcarata]CAF2241307.1 unnamed protein product [Rotaria magnacalcarata]CAF3894304.1 unnamed protein product [Rotaria magnacalcarata]CAF3967843.1 unnamed protein product [Rotaria magnacalcarata]